jgi:CO/xanthine dehydrogenase FAD-binding subunit
MQPFDYCKPATFDEVFDLLTQQGKITRILAGATDLIPAMRDGVLLPDMLVDVKGLPGISDIRIEETDPCCGCTPGACLYIGAAATMADIAASDLVRTHCAALAKAAHLMGNEQIRHRATLGGNIGTASPAADSAPPLYVLEAVALIRGPQGDRSLPIDRVFAGPRQTCLKPGEIIAGVMVPIPPPGTVCDHVRLARRKAGDLAIVSVAALAIPEDGAYLWRIALGAVGPVPVRSYESEAILAESLDDEAVDRAAAAAYGCATPIADIRSGIDYREAMIVNLTRHTVRSLRDRLN